MKVLQTICIFIIALMIQSCQEKDTVVLSQPLLNKEEIEIGRLEREIVEQTVNELVKIYIPMPPVPLPQSTDESNEDYNLRVEDEKSDYYNNIDTNHLTICLDDSLHVFEFYRTDNNKTSLRSKFHEFITKANLKTKYLNISNIKNIGKSKVIPMDQFPKNPWAPKNQNFKGWVAFSIIYFSPDKKTAAFTVHFVCGGLCGHGTYVEVKLKGDQWKITKKERTWVS
jgi:hypothetical protein